MRCKQSWVGSFMFSLYPGNGSSAMRSPADAATVPVPSSARPIGHLRRNLIYLTSIMADQGHQLVVRRRRDAREVARGYDAGSWAAERDAKRWEHHPTLQAFTERGDVRHELRATINNQLWHVSASAYYAMRRMRLVQIMRRFAADADSLYELGSGVGSIVFELVVGGLRKRIVGLELSPTGREVAERVAAHYQVEGVEFGHIDLLDSASDGFARLNGATVYTHYCLEQLPNDTEAVFRNLAAAGVRRAILIEPTFELLGWTSLRDLASRTYVLRQDYQRSIMRTAERLQREGVLDIVHTERLDFVSGHRNAGTLLVFDIRG